MNPVLLFLGGIGRWEVLLIFSVLGITALWWWAFIDCLKSDFTNNNKLVWVIVITLVPFGNILYLAIGRRQKVTL